MVQLRMEPVVFATIRAALADRSVILTETTVVQGAFLRLKAVCIPLLYLQLLAWPALPAQDSSFLLTTHIPESRFPGYYGNGRIGTVTSPRGVDPTPSYLAGVYGRAPGDVPRIAALPAWTEIDVFDGRSWLRQAPLTETVLQGYEQTVNTYA